MRIRLPGAKPAEDLSHNVDVKIAVHFIEYSGNSLR